MTSNQVVAFMFDYNETCTTLYSGPMPDNRLFIEKWYQMNCSDYAKLRVSYVTNYILCTDTPVYVNNTCRNGHFTCSVSNTCIIQNMVCDGTKDCPHGEDESVCSISCPVQTICETPSEHCVCPDTLYFPMYQWRTCI